MKSKKIKWGDHLIAMGCIPKGFRSEKIINFSGFYWPFIIIKVGSTHIFMQDLKGNVWKALKKDIYVQESK